MVKSKDYFWDSQLFDAESVWIGGIPLSLIAARSCLAATLLVSALLVRVAHGQETPSVLSKDIVSVLTTGTNISSSVPPRYAISRQTLPVRVPILFPNLFDKRADFLEALEQLDSVPKIDGAYVVLGRQAISEELGSLAGKIVAALPSISSEDDSALQEAKALLFQDDGLPTQGYKVYLSHEAGYNKLRTALAQEADEERQTRMRADLATLEREWEVLADRSLYAAAIDKYESASKSGSPAQADAWLSTVKPLDLRSVFTKGIGATNWIRFSQSQVPSDVRISLNANGRDADLPSVKRVSFDGTIIWLDRPYLQNGFLTDRGWRLTSDRPISIGSGADITNSILPNVISGVLLVRNLELQFSAEIGEAAIALLTSNHDLFLDNVTIKSHVDYPITFQRATIGLPGPLIVGVVADTIKKVPDPDPDRHWPN